MSTKGLDTFEGILTLMKNPTAFDKQLAEIKEATAKYQEVVESVVELSKVNDYTVSIAEREQESKKTLQDAKVSATAIVDIARKEAAEITNKANSRNKKIEDREKLVQARETAVAVFEKQLEEAKTSLSDQLSFVKAQKDELDLLTQEVEAKKAKLVAALNG